MSDERPSIDPRRIVVKIGSRSLIKGGAERFAAVANQVARLREASRSTLVVSSGAVALGRGVLGLEKRPSDIAMLQACAAIGQSELMKAWRVAFQPHEIPVAQLLLSHADLADRERYLNARGALEALWSVGAIPILNENDTVAVDEIRFGDNDQLAAMVSTLAGADLLVLLTDVEGLLDREGKRVANVREIRDVMGLVEKTRNDVGTGGMGSKLDAAHRAMRRGIPVLIADARDPEVLVKVIAGEDVGTLCVPEGPRISSRKHWIAYTLRPLGTILLDAGAAAVIVGEGGSLLPAGIVGVRGDFSPGDAVTLEDPEGRAIARGLVRYATRDVSRLAGAGSGDISSILGFHGGNEIVHRDDLVVL